MHTSLAKEGCIDASVFSPSFHPDISITPSRNEGIFSSYTKEKEEGYDGTSTGCRVDIE